MTRFGLALLSATFLSVAGTAAHARDTDSYLTGSAGYFNIFEHSNESSEGLFGLAYKGEAIKWGIRPIVGGTISTEGSLYGYAGFDWDIPLWNSGFIFTPSLAIGAYDRNGGGQDLGGAIEFRDSLELSYEFENAHRLGLNFYHMSNASIYDSNPGSESLMVTYSVPIGGWW